jgi:hypothetical protein
VAGIKLEQASKLVAEHKASLERCLGVMQVVSNLCNATTFLTSAESIGNAKLAFVGDKALLAN